MISQGLLLIPPNSGWYGVVVSSSNIQSDSLYAQFDLTVDEAPAVDGRSANIFAAFWNGGKGNRGRIWMGQGVDGDGAAVADFFRLGITKSSGSESSIQWTENMAEGAKHQIIVKYDFGTGMNSLYIDATDESDVAVEDDSGSDYGLKGFTFRHKDDGDLGLFRVDNLAVSQTFGDSGIPPLEPPVGIAANAIPGERVFVTWKDEVGGQSTGYRVERSAAGGAYEEVAVRGKDVNYYIDEDVVVRANYCYRVTALGSPDSAVSFMACASPIPDLQVETVLPPEFDDADGDLSFTLNGGRSSSYRLAVSDDLEEWTYKGVPVGGTDDEIKIPLDLTNGRVFYRIDGVTYPVLEGVGLTEEFRMPNNGTGAVLNVSSYGATSGNDADDDGVAIRAAISSAESGDIVYIPSGTYHVRSSITVKSGITVEGDGMDETVLLADTTILSEMFLISSGSSDITIQDLKISRELDAGTLVYGIEISTSSGSLAQRILIKDIHIEEFSSRGIQIRQAKHVKVDGCRIMNATELGGGGFGYGVAINDPLNNNNWVTGCVIGPVIRHGILIQYDAHNNLIEYNTCFDTTEDAYDFHGENEYANELRFNLAYWNDPSGWDGTPVGIGVGNTGATHDDAGPFNWIHHNEVYGYYGGMEVILDSNHQYIDGNYFHDNEVAGITLNNLGGDGVNMRGNLIVDNGVYGIRVESSNKATIIHNEISGHEIGVSVSANSLEYEIVDNDLTGNESSSELGSDSGMYMDNVE